MTSLDRLWLAAHPLPQPEGETDKNARGRVLVAGSSRTVPGAIALTGEAALRAGAGKVQLASVEGVALPLGIAFPEAAVFPLTPGPEGELGEAAGGEIATYVERCDTLVLGPGMSPKAPVEAILRNVLAGIGDDPSMVLDAAMIGAAATLEAEVRALTGRIVLTPHPGEMIQLMDCDEARIRDDPAGLVQEAAERFAATVLLKGAETWIACPGADPLHYAGGGHGLATAGSGDVLAGIIGGLLARGTPPQAAAGWGVWLHGEAGRVLARRIGPMGFLGRELLAEIPGLMAAG